MLLSSQWRGLVRAAASLVLSASHILRALQVKKLRIDASGGGDIAEQPFEMGLHGDPGAGRIVSLDRAQDHLVFPDRARDPPLLRQRQPAVAVDVDFYLLDQRPDPGMSGDLGDGGVKQFVGVMEGVAVVGGIGLALAFQDRMQNQDLARRRAFRGELRDGFLERLANDDGCRQRRARHE